MTDEEMLHSLDKRIDLIAQAQDLGSKAAVSQGHALESQINAIGVQIGTALTVMQAAHSDPAATVAGRFLLERLGKIEKASEDHEARIDAGEARWTEIRGGLRVLKTFVVGIGVVQTLIGIVALVKALG